MSNENKIKKPVNRSGVSLGSLIFVVLLTLKLAGIGQVATWSWLWVTSPLWIGTAIYLSVTFGVIFIGLIGMILINIGSFLSKKIKSEPTGYINIKSTKISKVVLDGKVLGSTSKVKASPGVHQITFIDNDGNKFEKSILVVAGETISVTHYSTCGSRK